MKFYHLSTGDRLLVCLELQEGHVPGRGTGGVRCGRQGHRARPGAAKARQSLRHLRRQEAEQGLGKIQDYQDLTLIVAVPAVDLHVVCYKM